MKLSEFLSILIIITNICQSNQQYLSLTKHSTMRYQIDTGTWKDLLGVMVECPNSGILKNFVLKKNSYEFWYEYQCYSAKSDDIDEGEPIIKALTLYSTYKYSITIQENIRTLSDYPVDCWLDYGMNSFKLYNDGGILRREAVCHGLKPKYSTKIEIKTEEGTALATRMDGLVGIVVGSQETEDDENIAYPLRGFKYKVDTTYSKEKPTVSYEYGYSILRNMKNEYESAKQTFESLRNSNTQKD